MDHILKSIVDSRLRALTHLSGVPVHSGLAGYLTTLLDTDSYEALELSMLRITRHAQLAAAVLERLSESKRQNEVVQSSRLVEFIQEWLLANGNSLKTAGSMASVLSSAPKVRPGQGQLSGDKANVDPDVVQAEVIATLCLHPTLDPSKNVAHLAPESDYAIVAKFEKLYRQAIAQALTLTGIASGAKKVNPVKPTLTPQPTTSQHEAFRVQAAAIGRVMIVDTALTMLMDPSLPDYLCSEPISKVPLAQTDYRRDLLQTVASFFATVLHHPALAAMGMVDYVSGAVREFMDFEWQLDRDWEESMKKYLAPLSREHITGRVAELMKQWNTQASASVPQVKGVVLVPSSAAPVLGLGDIVASSNQLYSSYKPVLSQAKISDLTVLRTKYDPVMLGSMPIGSHATSMDAAMLMNITAQSKAMMDLLVTETRPSFMTSFRDVPRSNGIKAAHAISLPMTAAFPPLPQAFQGVDTVDEKGKMMLRANRSHAVSSITRELSRTHSFTISESTALALALKDFYVPVAFNEQWPSSMMDAQTGSWGRGIMPAALVAGELFALEGSLPPRPYDLRTTIASFFNMTEPSFRIKMKSQHFRQQLATYLSGAFILGYVPDPGRILYDVDSAVELTLPVEEGQDFVEIANGRKITSLFLLKGLGYPYGVEYSALYERGCAQGDKPYSRWYELDDDFIIMPITHVPVPDDTVLALKEYGPMNVPYYTYGAGNTWVELPDSAGWVKTSPLLHMCPVPAPSEPKRLIDYVITDRHVISVDRMVMALSFNPRLTKGEAVSVAMPTQREWKGMRPVSFINHVWYGPALEGAASSTVAPIDDTDRLMDEISKKAEKTALEAAEVAKQAAGGVDAIVAAADAIDTEKQPPVIEDEGKA